jgi:hypothetical protein
MKLNIIDIAYHCNGIAGEPFHAVIFEDEYRDEVKVAVLFDSEFHCAVFDLEKLAAGNIRFGENSYRGDRYDALLRAAISARATE